MPRTKGARTGQKHKRKRVEPATDAVDARHELRVAALQAAETAAEAAFAQVQRENQIGEYRSDGRVRGSTIDPGSDQGQFRYL